MHGVVHDGHPQPHTSNLVNHNHIGYPHRIAFSISDVSSDELTLVPLQNKKGTFVFNNALGFVSMQLRCGPVLGCARLIAA